MKSFEPEKDTNLNDKNNVDSAQNKYLEFIAFVFLSDGSVYGIYCQHDKTNVSSSSSNNATDNKFLSTPSKI